MTKLSFRKYIPADTMLFKSLNIEWLDKFFVIEPFDELVLSNPQSEILEKGGYILMAELEKEVVGTFAFLRLWQYHDAICDTFCRKAPLAKTHTIFQ